MSLRLFRERLIEHVERRFVFGQIEKPRAHGQITQLAQFGFQSGIDERSFAVAGFAEEHGQIFGNDALGELFDLGLASEEQRAVKVAVFEKMQAGEGAELRG